MAYIELLVQVNQPTVDVACDFLISELGFSGVVTEEKYIDRKTTEGILKAYRQAGEDVEPSDVIKKRLEEKREELFALGVTNQELGSWAVTLNYIEDESWAENWKKYWDVQKIGERIVICPSWIEYEPLENELKIELDPGSAFGTGTHPTTRLCIRELEKYVKADSVVADIGCGSGILAIAAKKLGAKTLYGVDIDPDSIRVSNENSQINDVDCSFEVGTAYDVVGQYDIVVANILAHVIVDIMPELKRVAKPFGTLILSGIIEEKANDVLVAVKNAGLKLVNQTIEPGNGENWVCIIAQKET